MPSNEKPPLAFSAEELDLLGRTADAMSAYMGKPVLAEVMDAVDTGFEWVIFAIPLGNDDPSEEYVPVQIGGPDARLLGNAGGLSLDGPDSYSCEYLWAIQLSPLEGVRFIKVDQEGDEIAWTDDLREILPFALIDEPPADDDETDDGDDEPDGGDDADDGSNRSVTDTPPRTLH